MAKQRKRRLTAAEEFDIMILVLDKFLWVGLGIMLFGFLQLVNNNLSDGIGWIVSGAVVLLLMVVLVIKHYEIRP